MKPKFDNNMPIYLQIVTQIKMLIISGEMKPGEKVKSVRELAQDFGVNPNTMQRALSELEREELLYSERTAGRYITSDEKLIMGIRDVLAENEIKDFLEFMNKIGYVKEDIIRKIELYYVGGVESV